MSTISTLIAQARAFVTTLRSSIWAIDVRDGIANSIQKLSEAIEQCYSDVSNPTLQTEALEAALQNKIDEGEMAALTIGDHTITAEKLAQGVIDNTLTTSGAAADAAETGRQFGLIKADLDAVNTATSEDIGKALKAKTVVNGKVTEWEFGEAGSSEEVDALTDKVNDFIEKSEINIDFTLEEGYLRADGTVVHGAQYNAVHTSMIPTTPEEVLNLHTEFSEAPDVFMFEMTTYNSEGTATGRSQVINVTNTDSATSYDAVISIPSGAYFVAFNNYKADILSKWIMSRTWELASRVSEVESNADEALEKVAVVPPLVKRMDAVNDLVESQNSPQLVDKDSYTLYEASNYKEYRNVLLSSPSNGRYYANPIGYCSMGQLKAYDANDTQLTLTYGSSSVSYISVSSTAYIEKIDDTHIGWWNFTTLDDLKNGVVREYKEYTCSGTIAYFKIGNLRAMGGTSGDFGVTLNRLSSVYIPYGYDIVYNSEMFDSAWGYYESKDRFREIPDGKLNPRMQRSWAITDNLLDDRKIDWTPKSGYYNLKYGEKIPVTGGKTIICNMRLYELKEYTSVGVATSIGTLGENDPHTLASTTTYITCKFGAGTNAYQIPTDRYIPVYLRYAETLYPADDVSKPVVPMAQINGFDVNKNLFDQCIPDTDSSIVRMMKTFAIRELNHQRNAFRIGTFNLYINSTWTNRPTVKKELETYGIDICCFQEARAVDDANRPINIGDYLKGWQFGYCNTNADTKGNTRSLVSAYEVLSSEEVTFTANTSNSYLHCVIQLPRYKDYADGLTTLSIYTYHGKVDSATTRADEVTQILTAIAQDTADFIIVTGDTNDFSANKDIWAQFNSAGLTPVHDGKSETVTERNNSLDNIFISSNITCLYYDVINSGEWKYKPTSTSAEQAVSDHDLVFADLHFDFDSVIAERRAQS